MLPKACPGVGRSLIPSYRIARRPAYLPPNRLKHPVCHTQCQHYSSIAKNKVLAPRWYEKEEIRFGCTGCGKCCAGKPGYVWLLEEDIQKISAHLSMPRQSFMEKYVRYVEHANRWSLKEVPDENWRCVFLEGMKRCSIYQVRPTQCRTFPYWPAVLQSKESWKEEGKACEGIDRPDAPVVPKEHVKQQLEEQMQRVVMPEAYGLDTGLPPKR